MYISDKSHGFRWLSSNVFLSNIFFQSRIFDRCTLRCPCREGLVLLSRIFSMNCVWRNGDNNSL